MKTRELKALVKAKISSGMTKQETFDCIVLLNQIRIYDVGNAVRDVASDFYKKKYRTQNYLLITMILAVGIIQALSSVFFPAKIIEQTLPSDIFLMLTYGAIAFGVYKHLKLSYSAAIFLSIISTFMSIINTIKPEKELVEILYFVLVGVIGLGVIGMSSFLYSKYFRGYDIKKLGVNGGDGRGEMYEFKLEE